MIKAIKEMELTPDQECDLLSNYTEELENA